MTSEAPGRSTQSPRILLTNDDGEASPGSRTLAACLVAAGFDVLESYPSIDVSACGTAMWPIGGQRRLLGGRAMPWTPAFIVNYWLDEGYRPDAVICGINMGPNVGTSILHSGTVAAALTGLARGVASCAISSDDRYSTGGDEDGPVDWEVMAELAVEALRMVWPDSLQGSWNINIPSHASRPPSAMRSEIVDIAFPGRVLNLSSVEGDGAAYVRPSINDDSPEVRALRNGRISLSRLRTPFG